MARRGLSCSLSRVSLCSRLSLSLLPQAFFEKHFPELAKNKIPQGGYPDMGSGKFAEKLSVSEWMEFNNAQRAHYNYVEGVASILTFLLISGLFFPRLTVLLGAVYIVGRFAYGVGYRTAGARGRMVGALLLDLALLKALGCACYGAFNFAGGVNGLKALIKF